MGKSIRFIVCPCCMETVKFNFIKNGWHCNICLAYVTFESVRPKENEDENDTPV